MRTIYAKGILRTIAYDINGALDRGDSSKVVFQSLKKRLKRLDESDAIRIIWD